MTTEALTEKIFRLQPEDTDSFNECCMEVFHSVRERNALYAKWLGLLNRPNPIHPAEIPCLPIGFFKKHRVSVGGDSAALVFSSSTTTSGIPSRHHVLHPEVYHQSLLRGFETFYGHPAQYVFVALLPGYLERKDSSLIYMVQRLMEASGHPLNRFVANPSEAAIALKDIGQTGRKIFLLGVSFALLEMARLPLPHLADPVVMETGGMKGRGPELTREELHKVLKEAFGVGQIHSEYGMTELLSQAYSNGDGLFRTPPWMRIYTRQTADPLSMARSGKTGGVNVIDLANLHSCPFIATDDLGRIHADGSFEILGRFDHSDVRGCNLMA